MAFFSNADPYWDTDTSHFDDNPGDLENVRDASQKDCSERSGNPVILTTGNKIETVTDVESGGEMPLTLNPHLQPQLDQSLHVRDELGLKLRLLINRPRWRKRCLAAAARWTSHPLHPRQGGRVLES